MAGIAIAILLGGYSLLRPTINEATGLNLPGLPATQVVDTPADQMADKPLADASVKSERPTSPNGKTSPDVKATSEPLVSKMNGSGNGTPPPAETNAAPAADKDLKYGLLRKVGRERYLSPAGVLYTPGSAEGHRLEHLRRHTQDDPGRPGKHGVFDGDMEGTLATIDKAYEKAQTNQRTTKEVDGDRTIYTVDMGKRVGYVGGRDGNRSRKPMARRVKLVLEGNRLITAYPL